MGGKRTGRPRGRPPKGARPLTLVPVAIPELWEWDAPRERCLEMIFRGYAKTDIAAELKKHRSTIQAWTARPEFITRLAEKRGEHVETIRARRVVQTSKFGDKAALLLNRALSRAIKSPSNPLHMNMARVWGSEFRAWREQERVDFGDKVDRTEVSFAGRVEVNSRTSHEILFKDFLQAKLEDGLIDVEALPPASDAGSLVAALVEQVIGDDPTVTDILHEEDRARAEEGSVAKEKTGP